MQSAVVEQYPTAPAPPQAARSTTNPLLNLAAPILELILKMQAGIITPSHEIRPLVADLVRQLQQGGAQLRIPESQIRLVEFALLAFVDETVLRPENNFELRDQWERSPLQLEYFREHLAGEKFFERLNAMMQNMERDIDVVEVYYQCLILGYRGKYNIYLLEEQLKEVIKSVAGRLQQAGRLRPNALSAHWLQNDQPQVRRDPGLPIWIKIAGPTLIMLVFFIWLVFYFLLQRDLDVVR